MPAVCVECCGWHYAQQPNHIGWEKSVLLHHVPVCIMPAAPRADLVPPEFGFCFCSNDLFCSNVARFVELFHAIASLLLFPLLGQHAHCCVCHGLPAASMWTCVHGEYKQHSPATTFWRVIACVCIGTAAYQLRGILHR